MFARWRRLLVAAAIGAVASASVGPVSAEVERQKSACPYERAREAAAATAAASGAAFSLFELGQSADGLAP